jgi:hypothetical protein
MNKNMKFVTSLVAVGALAIAPFAAFAENSATASATAQADFCVVIQKQDVQALMR